MCNIKECKFKECKTIACFNIKGESKGIYCSLHKLDGMVDVKNKKCIHNGCEKHPIYNKEGEKTALYLNILVKNKKIESL